MFTGIIEELGEIVEVEGHADGARLTVSGPTVCADACRGVSIAVNGVCLTVADMHHDQFRVDVMNETVKRSSLASVHAGDRVNLERAVMPSTRLGGHIVLGHVDGVGVIESKQPGGGWQDIRISASTDLLRYIVEKGSVAIDGVSLTVVEVDATAFEVSLIPTTLALTTLGVKDVSATVNLEVDVVAKCIEKLVTRS
jgi:riboflavin synthase